MTVKSVHIFALAAHGQGISGGDRIWVELSRRWSKMFPVFIHTWKEGREMGERQSLQSNAEPGSLRNSWNSVNIKSGLYIQISDLGIFCSAGFAICYIIRILEGIRLGMISRLGNEDSVIIYNASEFWMDLFPCVILKIRYPKIKWVATWYQTAPNPLRGFVEQKIEGGEEKSRNKTYNLNALFYWLVQLPLKPLINKFADKVIVNNDDERKRFPEMDKKDKVIVLIGAVKLDEIEKYRSKHHPSLTKHLFDAVFQGRFHPQKGVVELIDIWRKVVDKIPNAKLAMIGDGPLMNEVKSQITKYKLQNNVKLFGFVFDGSEKYKIFSQSKIVVHPAYYDSGGMAAAEAMAFGLPAVGFNLKAYDSYYPEGMVKVKDENSFAEEIINLLKNENRRKSLGMKAQKLIDKNYSWDKRADEIFKKVVN